MESKLVKESLIVYDKIASVSASQESTAESVIPDTMPDAARILDTHAAVFLRKRSVETGQIVLEGELRAHVLWQGEEEDSVRTLELELPLRYSMECREAEEGDALRASIVLTHVESRMLNPRKLSLKCETRAMAEVYRRTEIAVTTGMEGEDLEILTEQHRVRTLEAVDSKSFVISEEFTLSSSRPAIGELLHYDVTAWTEEQKTVGGKLLLQGSAQLELRYLSEDGKIFTERFTAPFTQLMDIPETQEGSAELLLTQESAYVDLLPDGGVGLEVHLTAQMLFYGQRELTVVADAYSVHSPCRVTTESLRFPGSGEGAVRRAGAHEMLELPEPVRETVFAYAVPGVPEAGEDALTLWAELHALYETEEGALRSVCRKMELKTPPESGEEAISLGMPVLRECYVSPSAGNLEVRLAAEIPAASSCAQELRFVSSVEQEENATPSGERPSLILVRPGERSRWELAKLYGSTMALIEAANGGGEPGNYILIPKAR